MPSGSRSVPDHVEIPPILFRAPVSSVDCPRASRPILTSLRSEIEWATGRRLPLGEVVGRLLDFVDLRRAEFVEFCRWR